MGESQNTKVCNTAILQWELFEHSFCAYRPPKNLKTEKALAFFINSQDLLKSSPIPAKRDWKMFCDQDTSFSKIGRCLESFETLMS